MSFMAELSKAIGVNDDPTTVKSWLNTGHPLLNDIVSGSYHGGLPVGRLIEIAGDSSTGKTAIATAAMIESQRAGGVAGFLDHEHSFDEGLAIRNGLKTGENDPWMFKTPATFEQAMDISVKAGGTIRDKKLVDPNAPIIFVYDSLAAMRPKSTVDKDASDFNMNDTTALARATSIGLKSLAAFAEQYQFAAVFTNQTRLKPGVMFGDPVTTPGGTAMEFYASVRIFLTRSQITKGEGKDKRVTGQRVSAYTKKNKVHRPFERCYWDFMFREDGTGYFEPVGSVIDHLLDLNLLTKAGNRIEWDGKKLYRDEMVERINASGDRLSLYKLLPGWEADAKGMKHSIDWNKF